jgi:outer membrane receptor protein involved in Fe transport
MNTELTGKLLLAALISTLPAAAVANSTTTLEEVIVTAKKRQQSIADVPMSISALSGQDMQEKGIETVADLQKVVTGFRYSESNQGTPIYYIRGVGFNEASLGARANVAVYVDEVAIPFPIMTGGVGLDPERVEVLKGPQGTLFGQNTTSGAINYVAAKPTQELNAAITAGIGNHDYRTVRGHLSGPLSDSLSARIAFKSEDSGGWQESTTSSRELGDKDRTSTRLSLNWAATDELQLALTWFKHRDKSDLRANQFQTLSFQQDALARLYLPAQTVSALENYPQAKGDNQAADWGPNDPRQNSDMEQVSLRADWSLSDTTTLTYLYAHSQFDMDRLADTDGVSLNNFTVNTFGDITANAHELRLSGVAQQERLQWMIGFNADDSEVSQLERLLFDDTGNGYALVARAGGDLSAFFNTTDNDTYQEFSSQAVFGAVDYSFTDTLTGHFSARHTDSEVEFDGCTKDIGDGVLANAFNVGLFGGAPVIPVGGCITLDVSTFAAIRVEDTLEESNTSWRLGLDWKPDNDTMYYANISQGYKNGSFPNLSASEANQYRPVTEESLLAYEVGFKLSLADNSMQLSGALFYYDYEDKQIRGRVTVPVFGPLEALVNVPESEVLGLELQYDWKPSAAWTIGANITYLDTELKDYQGYNGLGQLGDFDGEAFPNTPELSANLDLQYDWQFSSGYRAFVGGNLSHQSDTNSNFGEIPLFDVDAYTVFDLRAGLVSPDENWSLLLWGRNVSDEYYWVSANRSVDTSIRVAGDPKSFGLEFTYHLK